MIETNIEILDIFKWLYTDKHYTKVLVYARGAGKSFACFDWLLYKLLANPDPTATGVYYTPSLKQTRAIIELPMQRYADLFNKGIITYNRSVLQFTIKDAPGSSKKIFFKSYEEEQTSRGFHPYVGVLDEGSLMPPDFYGQVLQPMFIPALSRAPEHTGIVIAGTPRGSDNLFHELFLKGQEENDAIKSKSLDVYQCGVFTNEAIKIMQMSMSEKDFNQEYMLDWNANVVAGAVYKDILDRVRYNNFGTYRHDTMFPVYMSWDLGYTHWTSVWFWQVIDGEVRIIDFYEARGQDITRCLNDVMGKPYDYAKVILPHDADHHNIRSPLTITEVFKNRGLRVEVMPPSSVSAGIEAVKLMLRYAKFDIEHTKLGVSHLEQYAYKIVRNKGVDRSQPDQLSIHADAADALRMMAISQSTWHTGRLNIQNSCRISPPLNYIRDVI